MTTTSTNSNPHPSKHRTDYLDVVRSVIRENPTATETERRTMFADLIRQDDYSEFFDDLIVKMWQLVYNKAVRAVFPPSKVKLREIGKTAKIERRTQEQKAAATSKAVAGVVQKAKEEIASRLLDFITPNGKKLRDCTGAQCATFGSWYTKVSKAVKPNQLVGDVMDNEKLKKLLVGG